MKLIVRKSLRSFAVLLSLSSIVVTARAQDNSGTKEKKGSSFYIMWGYNRDHYSRSTLHFTGSNPNGDYDFKVLKVRAHDQPDMDNFFRTPPTVPQYNLNIGFMFNEKKGWGIEGSWNHLKYVMNDNEVRHVKGEIYGQRIDQDTLISPDFVKFEHTNGNNYLMLSLVKRLVLYESKNNYVRFSGLIKPGGGVLIPKTDSRVLGYHNDGPFKLSGIVVGVTGGLRVDLFRYFFLDTGLQVAEAFYTWGKIYNGKVRHNFLSLQYSYAAGINIPIGY